MSTFGSIDVLVLNASAISLDGTLEMPTKRFDLMSSINQRGTFLMGRACLPHLIEADNPHILSISPPLEFADRWWGEHLAWTMMKYSMSLCVRGWATEFKEALLREAGVTDFDVYANDLTKPLFLDLLIDEPDGNYFKSWCSPSLKHEKRPADFRAGSGAQG